VQDLKKALVAVDNSKFSRDLVKYAFEYALRNGLDYLDFIHVWETSTLAMNEWIPENRTGIKTEEDLRKEFASLVEQVILPSGAVPVPYDLVITYGIPYEEIINRAEKENYRILLIGHRGSSGLSKPFLGKVAPKVVRHAPCTVLVYQKKAKK
jgi:nucleotide-binding universal stress UspA family protein